MHCKECKYFRKIRKNSHYGYCKSGGILDEENSYKFESVRRLQAVSSNGSGTFKLGEMFGCIYFRKLEE